MSVKAKTLCDDLLACVGKGNTYGKPECIDLAKLQKGNQKVMCAGFVKAALPSLYNGTNTIWRKGYLTDKGSISDHRSSNGYPKNVNARKVSQLEVGMAVFKWQSSGEPSSYKKDGLGNFCHIGIVTSVNPIRIVHCSSEEGEPIVSKSIGKFCAWGYLKGVDYGAAASYTTTGGDDPQKEGDANMIYQAKVTTSAAPLNIREEPSASASRVGKAAKGATVNVLEVQDGWSRISVNGVTGWASNAYLKKIAGTEQKQEASEEKEAENAETAVSEEYVLRAEYDTLVQVVNDLSSRLKVLEQDLYDGTDEAD